MDGLNVPSEQKEKLDRVAKLVLDIYQVLVRLQYLEQDWIIPGPHDIQHLIPAYRQNHIDDSIIYLYSQLPCLDPSCDSLKFFRDGKFLEPLLLDTVSKLRVETPATQPFFDDTGTMYPWVTALSIGNQDVRGTFLMYSAREDRIWLPSHTRPPTFSNPYLDDRELHDDEREHVFLSADSSVWPPYCCHPSRPAAEVLADVAVRFTGLQEDIDTVLRDLDMNTSLRLDITRPLYAKHGWPGKQFDGDAFRIDRYRALAARLAEIQCTLPLKEAQSSWQSITKDSFLEAKLVHGVEEAETAADRWRAKWALHRQLVRCESNIEGFLEARHIAHLLCPDGVVMLEEHRPLWEAEVLRLSVLQAHYARKLHALILSHYEEDPDLDEDGLRSLQCMRTGLANVERWESSVRAAYRASRADAERLCPGQTFVQATGWRPLTRKESWKGRVEGRLYSLASLRKMRRKTEQWLAALPPEGRAALADEKTVLDMYKRSIDSIEEDLDYALGEAVNEDEVEATLLASI